MPTITTNHLTYHSRGHTWRFTYEPSRLPELMRVCLRYQAEHPECWRPDDTAEVLRAALLARVAEPKPEPDRKPTFGEWFAGVLFGPEDTTCH